ncbi:hypothetical protein NEF87_000139 [Candidatus Lokiarchaeum ossiferum]|uniref:Major facilitator superfamily (MFS) profile domain-containing protein n=1 Tax=Candidatus Lokiarchaeum ossiferum TaxID=2951803 RepID=A0ABY6HK03_9ARCH|nr:hypothetical protein NEF87_000139 [Candidatus Lokiarchaeum sp. B-35]
MEKQLTIEKNNKTFKMYIIFFIGQSISLFGSSIVQFAGTWWITEQSQDPLYMSILMLLMFVPQLIIGPIAGVLADKFSRKKIIILSDAFQALVTLAIIIFAATITNDLWLFIVFLSIRYVGQAFQQPAVKTVIPMLVPDDKIGQINGISSLLQALLTMGSPFVGAILLNYYTISQIMIIDIISFGIAMLPLIFISFPNIHQMATSSAKNEEKKTKIKSSFFTDFKIGLKGISETPGLWILIISVLFTNLAATPVNVLASYFVLYDHGGSALIYSIIGACITIGVIGGSIFMSIKKKWKNRRRSYILFHFLTYGGLIIIGLAPRGAFWMIALGGFLMMASIPMINNFYITYMQVIVPKEKQGRVFSMDTFFSTVATPIGMVGAAPLANLIGNSMVFTLCGIIAFGILALFSLTKQYSKVQFDAIDAQDHIENLETTDPVLITEVA